MVTLKEVVRFVIGLALIWTVIWTAVWAVKADQRCQTLCAAHSLRLWRTDLFRWGPPTCACGTLQQIVVYNSTDGALLEWRYPA